MTSPCLGCRERELGCHSRCEKYQAFREDRERIYESRMKDLDVNEAFASGIIRAQKSKRKGGTRK